MSKIRVLHIYNDFIGYNGLIETFMILSKTTTYDVFELGVCVFSYDGNEYGRRFESFGAKLFSLDEPYGSNNIPRVLTKLWYFLRQYKPDIVHTHCLKGNIIGIFAAVLARVPVICGEELTFTNLRHPGSMARLRQQLLQPFLHMAMRCCDKFTFCSQALQAAYVQRQRSERFAMLYPPFDLDKYDAAVNAADTGPEKKGGLTVGFVGRLSEQKGVSVLLKAMTLISKRIPAAKLVYVGVGEQEAALRASAMEFGLDGNVQFLGFKSNVFECLKHMDVLVLPSRTESFGLTALEAMAMGVPVVATAVGGLKEVVVDGETGTLIPYGNFEKLAKAVIDLLSDDKRRLDMGKRGRERAFTVFHPSKYLRTLENLYLQLYNKKTKAANSVSAAVG